LPLLLKIFPILELPVVSFTPFKVSFCAIIGGHLEIVKGKLHCCIVFGGTA
jgi:hypothetical protein